MQDDCLVSSRSLSIHAFYIELLAQLEPSFTVGACTFKLTRDQALESRTPLPQDAFQLPPLSAKHGRTSSQDAFRLVYFCTNAAKFFPCVYSCLLFFRLCTLPLSL